MTGAASLGRVNRHRPRFAIGWENALIQSANYLPMVTGSPKSMSAGNSFKAERDWIERDMKVNPHSSTAFGRDSSRKGQTVDLPQEGLALGRRWHIRGCCLRARSGVTPGELLADADLIHYTLGASEKDEAEAIRKHLPANHAKQR